MLHLSFILILASVLPRMNICMNSTSLVWDAIYSLGNVSIKFAGATDLYFLFLFFLSLRMTSAYSCQSLEKQKNNKEHEKLRDGRMAFILPLQSFRKNIESGGVELTCLHKYKKSHQNNSWHFAMCCQKEINNRSVIHYITEKNAKCSKSPHQTQKVSNLYTRYRELFYGFDIQLIH